MNRITLLIQPITSGDRDINFAYFSADVLESLSNAFDIRIRIAEQISAPYFAFDQKRRQLKSDLLLQWLLDYHRKIGSGGNLKILALCDLDAYSNNLNFVFGEAHFGGMVAVVYLPRLRQEFYGQKPDRGLFVDRLIKEAIHELGHSFGLKHCRNPACVMYFSNSLRDTDLKGKGFCANCKNRLG
jgi:archaemetzincin